MKGSRYIRSASVLASAALILGAFVAPADAKKKKKPKPPPPPPACAPFAPGELGKDAPTTILTDAATADAPVVVDLTAEAGLPNAPVTVQGMGFDGRSHLIQNIQVDSANPSAGLYVKIEFTDMHDYDLYLRYPDGSAAANSGESNAAPGHDLGSGAPEGGWEAGTNYEMVKGINTLDCAGYTADIVAYLTNGGAVKLSMWLGEVTAEPEAPAK